MEFEEGIYNALCTNCAFYRTRAYVLFALLVNPQLMIAQSAIIKWHELVIHQIWHTQLSAECLFSKSLLLVCDAHRTSEYVCDAWRTLWTRESFAFSSPQGSCDAHRTWWHMLRRVEDMVTHVATRRGTCATRRGICDPSCDAHRAWRDKVSPFATRTGQSLFKFTLNQVGLFFITEWIVRRTSETCSPHKSGGLRPPDLWGWHIISSPVPYLWTCESKAFTSPQRSPQRDSALYARAMVTSNRS